MALFPKKPGHNNTNDEPVGQRAQLRWHRNFLEGSGGLKPRVRYGCAVFVFDGVLGITLSYDNEGHIQKVVKERVESHL